MGQRLTPGRPRRGPDRSAGSAWGKAVSPPADDTHVDPHRRGVAQRRALDGYTAVLVLAVVAFTVYRFCNTDHDLFAGTPTGALLDSLDGAVPGLLVVVGYRVMRPLAVSLVDDRSAPASRRTLTRIAVTVLPVYYVVVVVVWFLRQGRLPGDWVDLLEHLSFTQVFDDRRIFFTVGPAWAVSVVVLTSLLVVAATSLAAPVLQRAGLDRRSRIAVLGTGTALLVVVSLVWRAWAFGVQHRPIDGSFATWYGPVANLDVLAAGLALALVAVGRSHRPALSMAARVTMRTGGLAVLLVAALLRQHLAWVTVYVPTASAVGLTLLLAAEVLGPKRGDPWTRVLQHPSLQWLARMSLGLYLWHEPVLLALRHSGLVRQDPDAFVRDLVVVLAVSVVVSWATHATIQVPAARLAALADRDRYQGSHTSALGDRPAT